MIGPGTQWWEQSCVDQSRPRLYQCIKIEESLTRRGLHCHSGEYSHLQFSIYLLLWTCALIAASNSDCFRVPWTAQFLTSGQWSGRRRLQWLWCWQRHLTTSGKYRLLIGWKNALLISDWSSRVMSAHYWPNYGSEDKFGDISVSVYEEAKVILSSDWLTQMYANLWLVVSMLTLFGGDYVWGKMEMSDCWLTSSSQSGLATAVLT